MSENKSEQRRLEKEATKAELEQIRTQKGKKSRIQLISGIIFLLGMTVLVITLFLNFGDIKAISTTFHEVTHGNNWAWLLLAALMTIVYLLLWPLSLCIFSKALNLGSSFKDDYAIGETEHFYSGVTPFATGGQPFQVYSYKTIGVRARKSTGAVLATFAAHMIVTNIYAVAALCFFPFYIKGLASGALQELEWMNTGAFIGITSVGYFFNLFTLFFTFSVGVSNHVRNWTVGIMRHLAKGKLFGKWLTPKIADFENYCDNTQAGFKEILTHKKSFISAFFVRFAAMFCFYSIPYFLLRSFGATFGGGLNESLSFWVIFFSTSFAITAVVWVPTPGSTGGIDYMFAIVIGSLSASGLITGGSAGLSSLATSLMWRLFTYYFPLLVSFVFSAVFEISTARRLAKEVKLLGHEENALVGEEDDDEKEASPAIAPVEPSDPPKKE
jgi:glycosyltransferase 2 family protein